MILRHNGEIEIEVGTVLNSPTLEPINVYYNIRTNEFRIEVEFKESGGSFPHRRFYSGVNEELGGFTMVAVVGFIQNHAVLGLFTELVES